MNSVSSAARPEGAEIRARKQLIVIAARDVEEIIVGALCPAIEFTLTVSRRRPPAQTLLPQFLSRNKRMYSRRIPCHADADRRVHRVVRGKLQPDFVIHVAAGPMSIASVLFAPARGAGTDSGGMGRKSTLAEGTTK